MFTTRKSSAPSLRAKVSFAQMLPLFTLAALADGLPQYPVRFYERLWCPLVTLWSMVWQRLQADDTMAAVVQNLRRGGADALVRRRPPPSQAIRSRATTGYSDARRRLSLAWVAVDVAAYPAAALLEPYGQRWAVELNFRYLKAELGLAQLEVKSADLAQKEFYAGLITYNLIRGVMLAAAVQAGQPVGQLSLAGAWRLVRAALGDWGCTRSRPGQRQRLAELLQDVAACRLPRRKKPRPAEPRRTWHLRETFPPMRGSQAAARRDLKKQRVKSY